MQTWSWIPTAQKAPNGDWYGDYGGYVAIGCDTKTVTHCPTSFKQMLRTGQGYKIGINNNPTEASAAFSAVFAAALANGGSFNNIKPGDRLLPEAERGGQLRGDHRRSLDGAERRDEHRDLVGLPPGLGDQLAARLPQETGRS